MKGDVIKEFLVGLGFKVDQKSLTGFNDGISRVKQGLIALGGAAVIHAFTSIAKEMDKLNDLSNRINTPVSEIEELGHAAKIMGSSAEAAQASLQGVAIQAGLAATGVGRSKMIFEKLGISVKDANGDLKSSTILMAEIADKIKDMDKGQQMAIMSRLGIDPTMIEVMTSDISGLRDEFRKLYTATGVDANEAAKQAGLFVDALDRTKAVFSVTFKAIVGKLLPGVTIGMDNFRRKLVQNMPNIIRALEPFMNILLKIANILSEVLLAVVSTMGAVIDIIRKVDESTGGWATRILAVAAAWKVLNVLFMRSPIGILLGLGVAFALLMDDLMTFKRGGETALDWTKFIQFANIVSDVFGVIWAVIKPVLGLFGSFLILLGDIANMLYGAFSGAFDKVYGLVGKFIDKMEGAWKVIKGVGGSIADFFGDDKNVAVNVNRVAAQTGGGGGVMQPYFSPAMATAGAQQTITQKTEINVIGSTDPNATARSVSNAQGQVNSDMARNMQGRSR
jgi:hypothetical protein